MLGNQEDNCGAAIVSYSRNTERYSLQWPIVSELEDGKKKIYMPIAGICRQIMPFAIISFYAWPPHKIQNKNWRQSPQHQEAYSQRNQKPAPTNLAPAAIHEIIQFTLHRSSRNSNSSSSNKK